MFKQDMCNTENLLCDRKTPIEYNRCQKSTPLTLLLQPLHLRCI